MGTGYQVACQCNSISAPMSYFSTHRKHQGTTWNPLRRDESSHLPEEALQRDPPSCLSNISWCGKCGFHADIIIPPAQEEEKKIIRMDTIIVFQPPINLDRNAVLSETHN